MSDFTMTFTVEAKHIDENKHLNNVVYVQWMQQAALAHTESVYKRIKFQPSELLWVVRSHQIRYLKSAKFGDIVEIHTGITKAQGVRAWREYEFVLKSDHSTLAKASTEWVCLDSQSLKPKRIPNVLAEAFLE